MGEHEGWAQPPGGLLPNGLLPNEAASVIQLLDSERWAKAEEKTAQLIGCIQPNPPSEERRNAVAKYVQRLIMECFPCQVFTFGSVPLKTYLPDGDIDLTAFSKNQTLKDTWAHLVRDMLEKEEKNENAEFHVKEVQYIQAEVKIIKCLVENIVVDISFNQLGGLCTLCFLEEVDHLINQNHLFKRSIILIKAWCYYESRILGAHHGLISTYALETLVLYIFHVFNNTFAGPLEVLYRFLEFFSKFDWDNFCVSLWGPVSISSLPDVTAEPPRKDGGELLLSKLFLDACSSVYAVFPGLETQGQTFVSKHFNVIDPLRVNNNLGRSVSKGNFFRIRSAFAFGAKRLARLLDCPQDVLSHEVNQFFLNTWERHGSGHRPDAPKSNILDLRLSNPEQQPKTESILNMSSSRKNDSISHDARVNPLQASRSTPIQHSTTPSEAKSKANEVYPVSRNQTPNSQGNAKNSKISDYATQDSSSNQSASNNKGHRGFKPEPLASDIHGRYLFARTRSSPELTDTSNDVRSQTRRSRAPEGDKNQKDSIKLESSRMKNQESEIQVSHNAMPLTNESSSVRHSSRQNFDNTADINITPSNFNDGVALGSVSEDFSTVRTGGMHQDEQDIVNMIGSSATHGFNGQVPFPMSFASGPLPLPLPPSILASMGYAQRNMGGVVPTNIPLIEAPWGTNMQFSQGLVPPSLAHYFPGIGLTSNPANSTESGNENYSHAELNVGETEQDFWHEQERASAGNFDLDNGGFEKHQTEEKPHRTSELNSFVPSSRLHGSDNSTRVQPNLKDTRKTREESVDNKFQHQDRVGNELFSDDRTNSRPMSVSSLRSKTSSESSWEGSMAKVSKPARDKRGRKTGLLGGTSTVHGKGKTVSEHSSTQADDENREWNSPSGSEVADRDSGPQPAASLHLPRPLIHGFEQAQTSGSDSLIPIPPMLLGPNSRHRTMDNSGVIPFAFYPTGPPVPFVTMLPVYNFPADTGTSDASTSHFSMDEGLENTDSNQNFDSSDGLDQSEVLSTSSSTRRAASVEASDRIVDILNSDFISHWQNLQYGRFCQSSRYPAPLAYPSPTSAPPVYLQGRHQWDGPGRPVANNVNLITQLMGYPRVVPVAPLQSVSSRPTNVYQRFPDEMPRYRGGTGTYLPNPKITARERHSTNNRRGNYNYDRSDHNADRESWNNNSKPRSSGRNYSRNQTEKLNSRQERFAASDSRADRPWSSHRHESYPYHSQNGPVRSNSNQGVSGNMAYGVYPLPSMNPGGVSSNGPVVMLYPYDHNTGYGYPSEQLEFGSLGPMGFPAGAEVAHLEGRSTGSFDEHNFQDASAQQSSPDQPSSPHLQRSTIQRNYQEG